MYAAMDKKIFENSSKRLGVSKTGRLSDVEDRRQYKRKSTKKTPPNKRKKRNEVKSFTESGVNDRAKGQKGRFENAQTLPLPSIVPRRSTNKMIGRRESTPRMWSNNENRILSEAVSMFGENDWSEVAKMLPGRTQLQCLQRWKKSLQPGLVKGTWSEAEDNILLGIIKAHSFKNASMSSINWQDVADEITGRNSKQCRERWYLNLDPSIKREPWKPEEDSLLLKLAEESNCRWSLIARSVPGRTENNVKTRYHSLMRVRAKHKPWDAAENTKLINAALLWNFEWANVAVYLPGRSRGQVKRQFAHLAQENPELSEKLKRANYASGNNEKLSKQSIHSIEHIVQAKSKGVKDAWSRVSSTNSDFNPAPAYSLANAHTNASTNNGMVTAGLSSAENGFLFKQQKQMLRFPDGHWSSQYINPNYFVAGNPVDRNLGASPDLLCLKAQSSFADAIDSSNASRGLDSSQSVAQGLLNSCEGGGNQILEMRRFSSSPSDISLGGPYNIIQASSQQMQAPTSPQNHNRESSIAMLDKLLGLNNPLEQSCPSTDQSEGESEGGSNNFVNSTIAPAPSFSPPVANSEVPPNSRVGGSSNWMSLVPTVDGAPGSSSPVPLTRMGCSDFGSFMVNDKQLARDDIGERRKVLLKKGSSSDSRGVFPQELSFEFTKFLNSL